MERGVLRVDLSSGTVGSKRQTPQGGLTVDANLTRTGVFDYRMPDGSRRRELRPAEEVFSPDSLASYKVAPVTVDHPGRVHPGNWKTHAVGTLGETVRQNGNFVAGDVHLQHGDAIDRAERGELKEVSCGYTCDIDPTPGQYQGKPYDAVQRNIRINHVAIGPKGWGRMGADTALHMDSAVAISGEDGVIDDYFADVPYCKADEAPTQAERDKMHESAFADPANKKYPIDTAEHTKAAASYAAKEHNAGRLSDSKFGEMMARINRARKKFGIGQENQDGGADYLRADRHGAGASHMDLTPEQQAAADAAAAQKKAAEDADKIKSDRLEADLQKARIEAATARDDAAMAKTEIEKRDAEKRELQAQLNSTKVENELLKHQAARRQDAAGNADQERARRAETQRTVEELIQLRSDARMVFATTDDPEGKDWKADGKDADAIRREIIAQLEPSVKLDSLNAVSPSLYGVVIQHERKRQEAHAAAKAAAEGPRRADAEGGGGGDDDEEEPNAEQARKDMVKRKKDGWKMGRKDKGKVPPAFLAQQGK